MAYFTDKDSIALTEGNDLIIQRKYQEAINLYKKEMEGCLKSGNYDDFAKLFQSLADCYYLSEDFNKASDCYFAIVAYNIWQHPDIIYDFAIYNSRFDDFLSCWGTYLGYTLYGWDNEYADYLLGRIDKPYSIKEFCSNIGTQRLLTIFNQLKKDSRIERNDIHKDKPISPSEYYLFDKDVCIKIGKELFQHIIFEQLNFPKPSNF